MASTTTISVRDETGALHPEWTAGPVQLPFAALHTVLADDHRVIIVGGPTEAGNWGDEVVAGELNAVVLGSDGTETSSTSSLIGAAESALGVGLSALSVRRILEHPLGQFTIAAMTGISPPFRVTDTTSGFGPDAVGLLLIRLDAAGSPVDSFGQGGFRLITAADVQDGGLLQGAVCADGDDLLLGVMNQDNLWTSLVRLDSAGVQTEFSPPAWSATKSGNPSTEGAFPIPDPGYGNRLELLSSPTDLLDDRYYLTSGSSAALAAVYSMTGEGEWITPPGVIGWQPKRRKASLHDGHMGSFIGRLGWAGSGVYASTARDDIVNYGQGSTTSADDYEGWYTVLDWSPGGGLFDLSEGFREIDSGTWRAPSSGWILADLRIDDDDVVHTLTAESTSDKYFTDTTIRWSRLDRTNGHSEIGSADLVPAQPVGFRLLQYLQAVLAPDLSRALVGTVEAT